MEIGQNLRNRLQAIHKKATHLSYASAIPAQTIYRAMAGKNCDLATLDAIARGLTRLGCPTTIAELFWTEEDEKRFRRRLSLAIARALTDRGMPTEADDLAD